jgi:uncharacterized phage infection (PIP) family protein YhgE
LSILTKICIVVLVVLILLACPAFITQATVAPNYKYAYEQEVIARDAAQQTARVYEIAAARAQDQLTELRSSLTSEQDARQADVRRLRNQLAQREAEVADLQKQLASLATDLKDLRISHQKNVQQRQDLEERNMKLLAELDRVTDQARQLGEALRTCEGERDRYARANRLLKEQIAELEQQIAEKDRRIQGLKGQVASGAVTDTDQTEPVVQTDDRIRGTVTAVREGMASVNVGSAQGVRAGMQLMIYRGSNFVGYLRIEEVDVNQAAGTVRDNVLDPMRGDRVATPASLRAN